MTLLVNTCYVSLLLVIPMSLLLFSCSKGPDKKQLNALLFSAVSQENDRALRDLLNKGADVNARDEHGCTPLSIAAMKGNLSTVRLLLERGADANVPCDHGPNPLNMASSRGYEPIVRLLLEKGADVNRTDPQGWYALSYAIEAGHSGVINALIEHGAEINVMYSQGETPLIHAARKGRTEAVKSLLDRGADVQAIDQGGMSALMQAIDKRYPEIAKMLIERGSAVNYKAGNGYTPIELARSRHLRSVVRALQAAGAVGPKDEFAEITADPQGRVGRVAKELTSDGWEYFATELDKRFFLKASEVKSMGNDIYRIRVVHFFENANMLEQTVIEMNCARQTYRHISKFEKVIISKFGKFVLKTPIEKIPEDQYEFHEWYPVPKGNAMEELFWRICAKD